MNACELLQQQIGELFRCTEVKGRVRIRTPFMYPDGDYIDLFAETTGDVTTISDLGSKANPKDDLPAESRWFSDRCRFLSGSSGNCGAQAKSTRFVGMIQIFLWRYKTNCS